MANMKVTWFFKSAERGWSETLYREGVEYPAVLKVAEAYAKLRMALTGNTVKMTYIRASDDLRNGDSRVSLNGFINASATVAKNADDGKIDNLNIVPPALPSACDRPYSAIAVRMEAGTDARRIMYMRGNPDPTITGQPEITAYKDWIDAFNVWGAHVVEKWKMKAWDKTDANPLVTLASMTNNAGILSATKAGHGLATGTKVQFAGLKGVLKPLNGVFTVNTIDNATFEILNAPNLTVFKGAIAYRVRKPYYPAIDKVEVRGAVSRRTGRPFDSARGRRSSKA